MSTVLAISGTTTQASDAAWLGGLVLGSIGLVVGALWLASHLRLDRVLRAHVANIREPFQLVSITLLALALAGLTGALPGTIFLGAGAAIGCVLFVLAGLMGHAFTTLPEGRAEQIAQEVPMASRKAA